MIRKMKLARIGLLSAVKIGFFLSAAGGFLIGLFWGVVLALFSSLVAMAVHARPPGMGPGALVVLPVFFAIFCGFLGAAVSFLGALVYNLAAGASGGLEVEADWDSGMERPVAAPDPPSTLEPTPVAAISGERPVPRRSSFRSVSERPRLIGLRRAMRKSR